MTAARRSARNLFTTVPLDRSSEWRERADRGELGRDADLFAFHISSRGEVLVESPERMALVSVVEDFDRDSGRVLFLGISAGRPAFALVADEPERERLADEAHHWIDLRLAATTLPQADAGLAAYARALMHWHSRHRFCGRCGSPTRVEIGGHRRRCMLDTCKLEHFPRLDPAIIVLVEHDGRCLLGRQSSWPPRRYSVLAGFVEPGESLEDALVREVAEESGVLVVECDYHSSQPWPFPASLMLGFTARAASGDLKYGTELEHAAWYSPAEMLAAVQAGELRLPPKVSLSSRLIEDWFEERTGSSADALFEDRY